jgi:hypothetical protein
LVAAVGEDYFTRGDDLEHGVVGDVCVWAVMGKHKKQAKANAAKETAAKARQLTVERYAPEILLPDSVLVGESS